MRITVKDFLDGLYGVGLEVIYTYVNKNAWQENEMADKKSISPCVWPMEICLKSDGGKERKNDCMPGSSGGYGDATCHCRPLTHDWGRFQNGQPPELIWDGRGGLPRGAGQVGRESLRYGCGSGGQEQGEGVCTKQCGRVRGLCSCEAPS